MSKLPKYEEEVFTDIFDLIYLSMSGPKSYKAMGLDINTNWIVFWYVAIKVTTRRDCDEIPEANTLVGPCSMSRGHMTIRCRGGRPLRIRIRIVSLQDVSPRS